MAKLKKSGVVIFRNAFSKDQVNDWNERLISHLEINGQDPMKPKSNLKELYWSKPQIEARHHPTMIKMQKALLALWTKNEGIDDCVDLTNILTYNDRLRMRQPGHVSFLKPHLDNGTISRWIDCVSQHVYKPFFDGKWEDYDPFCINGRGIVDFQSYGENCSAFRAFQGWLSLSESEPGDGTLTILPLLKESLASIMIRPLLSDIPKDQLPNYEGVSNHPMYIDKNLHADLIKAMISLPKMNPGDCVFWHGDLVHAVEPEHKGTKTNTVLYIPAAPDCPLNRLYVERAKFCFESGLTPPDFRGGKKEDLEVNYKGRATKNDLNENALRMMGYDK